MRLITRLSCATTLTTLAVALAACGEGTDGSQAGGGGGSTTAADSSSEPSNPDRTGSSSTQNPSDDPAKSSTQKGSDDPDSPPPGVAEQLSYGSVPLVLCRASSAAQVTASPDEPAAGAVIHLCASGFRPGAVQVTLQLPGDAGVAVSRPVIADADGKAEVDLTMPANGPSGAYKLRAEQMAAPADGTTPTEALQDEAEVTVKPAVMVRPATGAPGATFAVALSGLPPGTSVTLYRYGPATGGILPYHSRLQVTEVDANGTGKAVLATKSTDHAGDYCVAFANSKECETTFRLG